MHFFRQWPSSWRNPGLLILPRSHLFWRWLLHTKQWFGKNFLNAFVVKKQTWNGCFVCRLHWKPLLATATLPSGSLFSRLELLWSGYGTSLLIGWPPLPRSGLRYFASTTVERRFLQVIVLCFFNVKSHIPIFTAKCWLMSMEIKNNPKNIFFFNMNYR